MDQKLLELERQAKTGDLAALGGLVCTRRRLHPTGYDITRPIHDNIINLARKFRHCPYTGYHDEESFGLRFNTLAFVYYEGSLIVTGVYQREVPFWQQAIYHVMRALKDSNLQMFFQEVSDLPRPLRERVQRYTGSLARGIWLSADDPELFFQIDRILTVWVNE